MRWLGSVAGMRMSARLIVGPLLTVSSRGTVRRAHWKPCWHDDQCRVAVGGVDAAPAVDASEATRVATARSSAASASSYHQQSVRVET